ncbi:unnamed protein product [Diabrotica balteata]|uniref:Endonuclease/exonuclease/phosphatase domain-containing protein n=1 Tax=Diabrotica balteata TaxID=107213 RepID=A0A9N9T3U6_DIABA|nr:unnamed protein product [Diabrotica balteata]
MARKQKTNVKLTAEVSKRNLRSSCNKNNNIATISTSKNVRKPAKRQLVKDLSPTPPEITIPTKTVTTVVQIQKTDPTDKIIPTDEQKQVTTEPIIAVVPTVELNLQKQKGDPTDPLIRIDERTPVTTEPVIAVVEEHKMDTSGPIITAVEQETPEVQDYSYTSVTSRIPFSPLTKKQKRSIMDEEYVHKKFRYRRYFEKQKFEQAVEKYRREAIQRFSNYEHDQCVQTCSDGLTRCLNAGNALSFHDIIDEESQLTKASSGTETADEGSSTITSSETEEQILLLYDRPNSADMRTLFHNLKMAGTCGKCSKNCVFKEPNKVTGKVFGYPCDICKSSTLVQVFNEIWLRDDIKSTELQMFDYNIYTYRRDRSLEASTFKRDGEVLIALWKTITSVRLSATQISNICLSKLRLTTSTSFIFATAYFPSLSMIQKSVEFTGNVENLAENYPEYKLCILGDFNLSNCQWSIDRLSSVATPLPGTSPNEVEFI